jgi:hypothetical protein
MITQRDNSPERKKEHERLQARSWLVHTVAMETETALFAQFETEWGATMTEQTSTTGQLEYSQPENTGAAGAINATMASEQVRIARQNIREA